MALLAAEKIVARKGIRFLTARRITSEIGYTVGSLYLVFKSLDDVVLHLNARTLASLQRTLAAAMAECGDPVTRIQETAMAFVRYTRAHTELVRLVFDHRPAGSPLYPDGYQDQLDSVWHVLEPGFACLQPDRNTSVHLLESKTLMAAIRGICTGYQDPLSTPAETDEVADAVQLLVQSFLRGSQTAAGTREKMS